MRPDEFADTVRAWLRAFRDILQDFFPDRRSWIWSNLLTGCATLIFLASTDPSLFPPGWADTIQHWGGVVGMVAAKMGWGWGGDPEPRTVYRPPPAPMPPNVAVVPATTKDGDL